MVVYSIKDMEKLSGVKAHTIRIWEKRYGIINPKRTETNIRYYTDEDLRHLLNVCILYKNGYKISKIAQLDKATIKEHVSKFSNTSINAEDQLDAMMLFILELDSYNFSKNLDQYIDQLGLEETMLELIYPLMERLSFAWLTGSFQGVHESFTTQIIKSKIQACIESLEDNPDYNPRYIIYLPEQEKQELSLLYLNFILKKNRCKVINLGNDVNLKDLLLAIQVTHADFVFTIVNEEVSRDSFQNYVNQICSSMNGSKLLLTGYQAVSQSINWPEKTIVLKNLNDTIDFIQSNQ